MVFDVRNTAQPLCRVLDDDPTDSFDKHELYWTQGWEGGTPSGIPRLRWMHSSNVLVCASTHSAALIWDVSSGNPLVTRLCGPHSGEVGALAVSSDDSVIATGSDDGVIVFWSHKGEQRRLHGHVLGEMGNVY